MSEENAEIVRQEELLPQYWIAPTLPGHLGPREWADAYEEAVSRGQRFSNETGHDYEVYERLVFIRPHAFSKPKAR